MARSRSSSQTDDVPKVKISRDSVLKAKRLISYIAPFKWKFFTGLVFLFLTSCTALVFPKLMGLLVDTARDGDYSKANLFGFILFGVLTAQSIFSFFRIYLFVNVTENTLAHLRRSVYSRLITLPMNFFSNKRVGELNSRMSSDLSQLQDTLTTTIAEFMRQTIIIIGGVILISFISLRLTLLMLTIVPLIAVSAVVFGRFIRRSSRDVQDEIAVSNTIVEETMQGIANVKSFANEFFEFTRYEKSTHSIVNKAVKVGMYRGVFASFIIFCLFGAIVAVVWYGVRLAINNELSLGDLISFVLYSVFVGASIGGIADLYAQIQKALGATERLFDIVDEAGEEINPERDSSHLPVRKINGAVAFENVVFTYPSRANFEVLKNVSFEAEKGQTIAIVGPSGSGKSTLVSLLLRFYDPQGGKILIDGINSTEYSLNGLRRQMAVVPQDVLLFGGSIRENISYGKVGASMDEIIDAAKKANAHQFIESFPEKYDTLVGERGVKLSGGQRQRIAIARAVLKNPAILILDEATSSLDSESERLVQEALDKLMQNRTSIVIAHRLSTVRKADKIIVIERGEVRESGTHSELMQISDGLYRSLSLLQFESEPALKSENEVI